MRISIELVPRSRSKFAAQLDEVRQYFPAVDTINVPDVLRFSMRSWQGCARAKSLFANTIPHIRAMDVDRSASRSIPRRATRGALRPLPPVSPGPSCLL